MKLRNAAYISIFSLLIAGVSCKENTNTDSIISIEKPAFNKEGELTLIKASGQVIRTIDIEVADTAYEQEVDLKNRDRLKSHQGVLFLYPQEELRGYYMTDIRFPLDLIHINSNNVIVSFSENTTPLDDKTFLPSKVPSQLVLKINGGLSEEWIIEVGDRIEWKLL